ncbi:MAG: ABC transporter substrate-binding protein [Deltaproteobacteria bacterium]|nr:ABC transporter substrate-binding protein [Deltaproteobacteria bacterium]
MKRTGRLVALISCLVILSMTWYWFRGLEQPATPRPPVRLAVIEWPGFFHIYVAKEKRFFEREGVQVDLVLCRDNPEMNHLLETAEIDASSGVLSDMIFLSARGTPINVVYVADFSDSADVILASSTVETPADLKGKVIGFEALNSFSHIFVLDFIKRNGIKETDVIFKLVPAMKVLDELEAGSISAGHTWEPVTSKGLARGYHVIGKAGDSLGIITDLVGFRADVVQSRPDQVQAVVTALLKAQEYCLQHPEETIKIAAAFLKTSRESLRTAYPGVHHATRDDNLTAFKRSSSPTSLFTSGKYMIKHFYNTGQVGPDINLETILAGSFVQGAKIGNNP